MLIIKIILIFIFGFYFFFFSIKNKNFFQNGNNFFRKFGLQKIKKHTRACKAFANGNDSLFKNKKFHKQK